MDRLIFFPRGGNPQILAIIDSGNEVQKQAVVERCLRYFQEKGCYVKGSMKSILSGEPLFTIRQNGEYKGEVVVRH